MKTLSVEIGHLGMTFAIVLCLCSIALTVGDVTIDNAVRIIMSSFGTLAILVVLVKNIK